jgi:hypothetical protein
MEVREKESPPESRWVLWPSSWQRWWQVFTLTPTLLVLALMWVVLGTYALATASDDLIRPATTLSMLIVLGDHIWRLQIDPTYSWNWNERPRTRSVLSWVLSIASSIAFAFLLFGVGGSFMQRDWVAFTGFGVACLVFLWLFMQFQFSPLFRHRGWWRPQMSLRRLLCNVLGWAAALIAIASALAIVVNLVLWLPADALEWLILFVPFGVAALVLLKVSWVRGASD